MLRRYSANALLPIGAAALAAMTAGHALVLASAPPTGYRHVAQAPALEIAVALAIAGLIAAIRRVVMAVRRDRPQPDWALPSLTTIRALGLPRVAVAVLSLQTITLFVGEIIERHTAGLPIGGYAGLFGSTTPIAPIVHVVVGCLSALVLYIAARVVCRHAAAALAIVRAALAWLERGTRPVNSRLDSVLFAIVGPQRRPLAYNLANRPPPAFGRLA